MTGLPWEMDGWGYTSGMTLSLRGFSGRGSASASDLKCWRVEWRGGKDGGSNYSRGLVPLGVTSPVSS